MTPATGPGSARFTIYNVVQGEWGGLIGPFLGGWSDGMVLASGEAHLDNFIVDSGNVIPEPATLSFLALGSLALLRKLKGYNK